MAAQQVGQGGDEEGADDGGAFSEDVVDAEVFAALFGGDEPHKVGAADGLDASLEEADGESCVEIFAAAPGERIGSAPLGSAGKIGA